MTDILTPEDRALVEASAVVAASFGWDVIADVTAVDEAMRGAR